MEFNLPPLREDYFELDRKSHIVHVEPEENRERFTEMLEQYGFTPRQYDRARMNRSFLPFAVNFETRQYSVIWSITIAGIYCNGRLVMTEDVFMKLFDRDIRKKEE